MRFRRLHRRYAAALGYFWLLCPLCGQEFGGHEWRSVNGSPADIPHPDGQSGHGLGICPDCTAAGRGGDPGSVSVIIELDEPGPGLLDIRALLAAAHRHPDDEPEAVHDKCPDCCSLDLRRMCADCLYYLGT